MGKGHSRPAQSLSEWAGVRRWGGGSAHWVGEAKEGSALGSTGGGAREWGV